MKKAMFLFILIMLQNTLIYAQEDNYDSYETIIQELSSKQTSLFSSYSKDEIEVGFGYVNSTSKISNSSIPVSSVSQQGLLMNMGMQLVGDLTTLAQISFTTPTTKRSTEFTSYEFDLIGKFTPQINKILIAHIGAGIGVRSVEIKAPTMQTDFTNPLVLMILGAEAKITPQVGFLTEIGFKNSLTNNYPEKYVVDLSVRVNGHF